MHTLRGEMNESDLTRKVIEEPVPCGTCRTTQYFAADGELVRQDVEIAVDPKLIPGMLGEVGEL